MSHKELLPCIIIGSSHHAGVIIDALSALGDQAIGIVDPNRPPGSFAHDLPILGGDDLMEDLSFIRRHSFAIGIGSQSTKSRLACKILNSGGKLRTIIHPRAFIAGNVIIGEGTFIAMGAMIATGTQIGRFAIINTGCSIDHDSILADGVQIGPGARLAGNVKCQEGAFIGTNATILPKLLIGRDAVVGAGAVVIRDVPARTTVVGNPAHAITPKKAMSQSL